MLVDYLEKSLFRVFQLPSRDHLIKQDHEPWAATREVHHSVNPLLVLFKFLNKFPVALNFGNLLNQRRYLIT